MDKDCFLGFYITILIFSLLIIVLSVIQLCKGEGFGYNGIIDLMNSKVFKFNINKNQCYEYFSKIKFKKNFANVKTIFNLAFNSAIVLYSIMRYKHPKKSCQMGVFISTIIMLGYFTELAMTIISLVYFAKTDFDSEDFEVCNRRGGSFYIRESIFSKAKSENMNFLLDKIIIIGISLSFVPSIIGVLIILSQEIEDDPSECVEKDFCWICEGIGNCLSCFGKIFDFCCQECCLSLCQCCVDSCSTCCESCCNCCTICCKNRKKNITIDNNQLQKQINELEKENRRLGKEISVLRNLPTPYFVDTRINVIKFYMENNNRAGLSKYDDYYNNLFLSEINTNLGMDIDSQKILEINLYYLNEKLREKLSQNNNNKLFSNPVIDRAGKTFERGMVMQDLRENKLVLNICNILRDSNDLTLDNLIKIKQLLMVDNKYYRNPIVNKSGETEEGSDGQNYIYKNIIILDIIDEIKILDEKFFSEQKLEGNNARRINQANMNNIEITETRHIFIYEKN